MAEELLHNTQVFGAVWDVICEDVVGERGPNELKAQLWCLCTELSQKSRKLGHSLQKRGRPPESGGDTGGKSEVICIVPATFLLKVIRQISPVSRMFVCHPEQ